jgi:thioredoxin reductase (NADPH)
MLFALIGALPHTAWLDGAVYRDDHGFVVTGPDLPPRAWPPGRPPLQFETSLPGVFAVGDVRANSVKRVASAVGEGAVVMHIVHEYGKHPIEVPTGEMEQPVTVH